MSHFIYTLNDPQTGDIRYVGQTDNPQRRLYQHIRRAKTFLKLNWEKALSSGREEIVITGITQKEAWIMGLLIDGQKPNMEIVETTTYKEVYERESYWISTLGVTCNLTNSVGLTRGVSTFKASVKTLADFLKFCGNVQFKADNLANFDLRRAIDERNEALRTIEVYQAEKIEMVLEIRRLKDELLKAQARLFKYEFGLTEDEVETP